MEGGGYSKETSFLEELRKQFGSSEEFCAFEREFYSQREEIGILRQSVDSLRASLAKAQDAGRVLELQLVSEKATREQEVKNAAMDREKQNMQFYTQTYGSKCDIETWKRKADAAGTESNWLKEQLKKTELEKTEALRKLNELNRQSKAMERYKLTVDGYLKRQKSAMAEIEKRMVDLDKARKAYSDLVEGTEKEMKCMAVSVKDAESRHVSFQTKVQHTEKELATSRAELVQSSAALKRSQNLQNKKEQLVNKLLLENKDLHGGFGLFVSSLDDKMKLTEDVDDLRVISDLHEEIMQDVVDITISEQTRSD